MKKIDKAVFICILLIFLATGWINLARISAGTSNANEPQYISVLASIKETGVCSLDMFGRKHFFSIHFMPVLYLIFPFYFFLGNALAFSIIRALSFALAAYAAYLIGIEYFKDRKIGLLISLLFVFYLPVSMNMISDFQPEILYLPLLMFFLYYMIKRNYLFALIIFSTTYLIKEEMPLVGIFLGIYLMLFTDRKKVGLWFSVFSCMAFIFIAKILMPFFDGGNGWNPLLYRYGHLGSSYFEIFLNIFRKPLLFIAPPYFLKKIFSLFVLFCPLLFLPLLSMDWLIITCPIIIYSYLSSFIQLDYGTYYVLPLVPFFFIATTQSLKKLFQKYKINVYMALYFLLIINISVSLFFHIYRGTTYYLQPISNNKAYLEAVKFIHPKESVLTSLFAGGYLSDRSKYYFNDYYDPEEISRIKPDIIFVNFRYAYFLLSNDLAKLSSRNIKSLLGRKDYFPIFFKDDILLLGKKGNKHKKISFNTSNYNVAQHIDYTSLSIKPKIFQLISSWMRIGR